MVFGITTLIFLSSLALPVLAVGEGEVTTVKEPDLFFDFGAGNIFAGGRVPCPDGESVCINWIGQYISAVYQFGVGLAAILAVVVMMVGGFIWLSAAGNSERVKTGQSFVWSALAGLVIALFSFVLLNTLNPRLTNLDPLKIKTIEKQELGSGGSTSGQPSSYLVGPDGYIINNNDEEAVRELLETAGVKINKDPCLSPQSTNCTNVAGLPSAALQGLLELAAQHGSIVITGGTESGHSSHGVGKPIVDLRHTSNPEPGGNASMENYITTSAVSTTQLSNGIKYTMPNGSTFVDETPSGGTRHWHVTL